MKTIVKKVLGLTIVFLFVLTGLNFNALDIFSLPNEAVITYDDVTTINEEGVFGSFVKTSLSESQITVGGEKQKKTNLTFKLFGFIPLKSIEVEVLPENEVYVGGIPLGFALETAGVIVVGENSIMTKDGARTAMKTKEIKAGDIINKVSGKEILGIAHLQEIVNSSNGERLNVEIIRKDQKLDLEIVPELDESSGEYKLGLWVRDDASGVGTLTYVDSETNRYGALGHPITDYETGVQIPVKDGKIYPCTLVGITKGQKGKPGELRCLFMQGKNSKGTVEKNTAYGVYGEVTKLEGVVDSNLTAEVGSRMSVKPGKAKIVSSVSGVREEYDIEIIKASYQSKSSDKSMVIRVTDPRLLALTGGILQGMSGSPILQDGKLVGAVTHVFISDPTKGYGIYVDWMLSA